MTEARLEGTDSAARRNPEWGGLRPYGSLCSSQLPRKVFEGWGPREENLLQSWERTRGWDVLGDMTFWKNQGNGCTRPAAVP